MVGCFLIGWTPLLSSTRNSPAGLAHLLNDAECTHIIHDVANSTQVQGCSLDNGHGIKSILMDDEFDHESEIELPTNWTSGHGGWTELDPKRYEEIVFYLHTSGSTGHPKLVGWSHKHALHQIRSVSIKNYSSPSYSPLPIFHAIGIELYVLWPFGSLTRPTFLHSSHPDAQKPITAFSLLNHLRAVGDPKTVVHISPATLEELVMEDGGRVEELSKLCQRAFYGGAPMRKEVGDRLAKGGVKVQTMFGTSEVGCMTVNDVSSLDTLQDWIYVSFAPAWNLLYIPEDSTSSICEIVALQGKEISPLVLNRTDPPGFASGDMWAPHPDPRKKGLWKHVGRKGAVTVLSNGEKTDNKQMEVLLQEDPLINRVVVFGAGRFLNGIILSHPSPLPSSSSRADYITKIWPTIQKVNEITPSHSRLVRELVLVEDKEKKPFKLTDKLSVRVKETLKEYEREIEDAYMALEEGSGGGVEVDRVESESTAELIGYMKEVLHGTGVEVDGEETDLFAIGMDSLQAIKLRSAIIAVCHKLSLGSQRSTIPRNIVYTHSTLAKLAKFIQDYVSHTGNGMGLLSSSLMEKGDVEKMILKYVKYVDGLKTEVATPVASGINAEEGGVTILLTGATGTVGSAILASLLIREEVEMVVCLIRSGADPIVNEARIREAVQRQGGPPASDAHFRSKVQILEAKLEKENLGLGEEDYRKITNRVTHIIHCAWTLNFNWGLVNFESPHIVGTYHLIKAALDSSYSARLILLSSIDSAHSYSSSSNLIPELMFDDPCVTSDMGYGRSKFVAEAMVRYASERKGLRGVVIRSGQVAGCSVNGYWNPMEYIPMVIKSSFATKSIPDDLAELHWIPSDMAGILIVDLVLASEVQGANKVVKVYHLENRTPTPWSRLVTAVSLASGGKVRPVSFTEWKRLTHQALYAVSANDIPAVKIIDFLGEYTQGPLAKLRLDTVETEKAAPGVNYGGIGDDLLAKYVGHVQDQLD